MVMQETTKISVNDIFEIEGAMFGVIETQEYC